MFDVSQVISIVTITIVVTGVVVGLLMQSLVAPPSIVSAHRPPVVGTGQAHAAAIAAKLPYDAVVAAWLDDYCGRLHAAVVRGTIDPVTADWVYLLAKHRITADRYYVAVACAFAAEFPTAELVANAAKQAAEMTRFEIARGVIIATLEASLRDEARAALTRREPSASAKKDAKKNAA